MKKIIAIVIAIIVLFVSLIAWSIYGSFLMDPLFGCFVLIIWIMILGIVLIGNIKD